MAERNKIAMDRETETKEKIYLELKRETTKEKVEENLRTVDSRIKICLALPNECNIS